MPGRLPRQAGAGAAARRDAVGLIVSMVICPFCNVPPL